MVGTGIESRGQSAVIDAPDAVAPGDGNIFVSIASYRDPQLGPTLDDCLAKASFPDRLRFGICWQHGLDEPAPSWFGDNRFKVLDVDWRDSRGACWARSEVMKLWAGEEWFLQLDSHHRFAANWDVTLLEQMSMTGSAKAVLTTYAHPFTPSDPHSLGIEPMLMEFDYFTQEGIVLCRPGAIPAPARGGRPVRSRFLSAHFLFARGGFVSEVPYDPDLYFIGEEITLAVRAFTHGYELFHPSVPIVWHEYTREGRAKHWDDHGVDNGVLLDWGRRDIASREKIRDFLTAPHVGRFGCGTARTFTEYENYAGLNFRHRRVQDHTRHHREPPGPPARRDWVTRTRDYSVRMVFDAAHLPARARERPHFWCVTVHDVHGDEIHRADADTDEITRLLADEPEEFTIVRTFESTAEPATWTILPVSESHGWLEPITGRVDAVDIDGGAAAGADLYGPLPIAVPTSQSADDAVTKDRVSTAGPLPGDVHERWADRDSAYPVAAPDLTFTEVAEGFVVTRSGGSGGRHTLNVTGVLMLELANGRHSVAEIIRVVADTFGLPERPETEIREFFAVAAQEGLVRNSAEGIRGDPHG